MRKTCHCNRPKPSQDGYCKTCWMEVTEHSVRRAIETPNYDDVIRQWVVMDHKAGHGLEWLQMQYHLSVEKLMQFIGGGK